MNAPSDSIVQALQSAFRLECTCMEEFHTQEHYWQRYKYKSLKKTYDCLVASARCRKRTILDRLLQFDVTPNVDLGFVTVYGGVTSCFNATLARLNALNDAYQTIVSVCRQSEDSVTEDLANDAQYDIQKLIKDFEAKLRQISDVGEPAYLTTVM